MYSVSTTLCMCVYIISDGRGGRLDEIQLSILQTPHHSTALEAGADIVAGEEIFKEVHCTCMYTCTFVYDVYTDSSLYYTECSSTQCRERVYTCTCTCTCTLYIIISSANVRTYMYYSVHVHVHVYQCTWSVPFIYMYDDDDTTCIIMSPLFPHSLMILHCSASRRDS